MKDKLPYEKGFHVSWDQIHRDSRALAWRLENKGPENGHWRGLIAMSQKLTPSIGKIENEEIYYGFGYHGVGVSSAPWTGYQLSKLVFSSNSKNLNISKIYKCKIFIKSSNKTKFK